MVNKKNIAFFLKNVLYDKIADLALLDYQEKNEKIKKKFKRLKDKKAI